MCWHLLRLLPSTFPPCSPPQTSLQVHPRSARTAPNRHQCLSWPQPLEETLHNVELWCPLVHGGRGGVYGRAGAWQQGGCYHHQQWRKLQRELHRYLLSYHHLCDEGQGRVLPFHETSVLPPWSLPITRLPPQGRSVCHEWHREGPVILW